MAAWISSIKIPKWQLNHGSMNDKVWFIFKYHTVHSTEVSYLFRLALVSNGHHTKQSEMAFKEIVYPHNKQGDGLQRNSLPP